MKKDYEIIVIGGGIVGNSIAYHLSEKGQKNILVIDKYYPLSGTSGATQAWVWSYSKKPATYASFNKYSSELYPYLEKKIGDLEYHRTGGITPFFSTTEQEEIEKDIEDQRKEGIKVDILSPKEVLAKEPVLSDQIAGAVYSPSDGNVNPFRVIEGYIRQSQKQGVDYSFYNEVTSIEKRQGKYFLSTTKGTISCERLVLAGGPWTTQLGNLLNTKVPTDLVRGQVLVTEPLTKMLNHTIGGMMRQMDHGPVLIGYSMERVGFDRTNTLDVLSETARKGIQYVPKLEKANILRCFSGIRVIPKDGVPILGKIPTQENLYVAVTHSGVTLSPVIGKVMSELLIDDRTSISIDDYKIDRFSEIIAE